MPVNLSQMSGREFGKWTVIDFACRRNGSTYWLCRCACGAVREIDGSSLRRGDSSSCKSCSQTSHGHAYIGRRSVEYVLWCNMIARCYNEKHEYFHNYGGRGIKVCQRWRRSFSAFLADVGPRPSPDLTIDRYPDNDGDYRPGNVRWATRKQQAANKRRKVGAR